MDQRRDFNALWNPAITTLHSFTSMRLSNSVFPEAASSTAERVNKETQFLLMWTSCTFDYATNVKALVSWIAVVIAVNACLVFFKHFWKQEGNQFLLATHPAILVIFE